MMGELAVQQEALFYSFSLEDHVPTNHLLRSIDRFVDLAATRSVPTLLGHNAICLGQFRSSCRVASNDRLGS